MNVDNTELLREQEQQLNAQYQAFQSENLDLDLTRGKPSEQQVSLSNSLDVILDKHYKSENGTDCRNYGGLKGINEARFLGAELLQLPIELVIAGGNSSLSYMYYSVLFASLFGPGQDSAWGAEENIKFLCPVPGYDRHFAICEEFGIEMLTVPMTDNGPDMDIVESLIAEDPSIKGMWCVPKYQNPTGITFSDDVVERIAKLGKTASSNFRVFWDNAYAVHHIGGDDEVLANIMDYCQQHGTENSVYLFASTSKITQAGAGIAFMGASEENIEGFIKHLGVSQIGPDKCNQLRHAKLFPNLNALTEQMDKHAQLLKPRFEICLKALEENFSDNDLVSWTKPKGGYFISVDTQVGLAKNVVKLAAQAGVKLTPAGATFPYGNDPQDCNIRLAPTFPSVAEVEKTMQVFVTCVKLASIRKALES